MRIHQSVFVRSFALGIVSMALSFAFVVTHANANNVSECDASIAALRADTESVAITGKNAEKNRAGLIGKLDGAAVSLGTGKLCTALQKLNDYRDKINQLIASGSINSDPNAGVTGQDLVNDVDAAIACVQNLIAASGTTCVTAD